MSAHVNQVLELPDPPESRSRRISIAELAKTGQGPASLLSSHRTSGGGSFSGGGGTAGGTPRFAQLSRRVTRLIGMQKSLRGSAIREDSRSGGAADDFMSRMRLDESPGNPRFSATLSTEGQYATFKCYERLARRCLLTTEPVTPQELPHTRTPMEMVRTRFELANLAAQPPPQQQRGGGGRASGSEEGDEAVAAVVGGSRSHSRLSHAGIGPGEIPLPGHSLTAYTRQQMLQSNRRISRERRDTQTADAAAPPQRNAQLERQIRQSYRLENVMEIIDYLRHRRGLPVTNQRFLRHQIHPVEHYQMWVRLWNKDFVVRPRGPGEEGALKGYQT